MSPAFTVKLPAVAAVFSQLLGRKSVKQWTKSIAAPKRPARKTASKKTRKHYERIFSLPVTLWYLIFQRLSDDKTLAAVVKDIHKGGADRLSSSSKNPLSKKIQSTKTGSYNEARQRLPLEFVLWVLQSFGERVQACFNQVGSKIRTFQLIDGSTLPMLWTSPLAKAYPPARNQNGDTHWCLMRVVVGFCAFTGNVLSAVENATRVSEQAMTWRLMELAAKATVWIGDSNFGIWSIGAKALQHDQDVIVRLTSARAKRLAGKKSWRSGQEKRVEWRRGKRDKVAKETKERTIRGRLIFVRLYRDRKHISLWLFTTLMDTQEFSLQQVVQLYGRRWQAELNFRYLKTSLELEQLDVATPQMARKEFFAGLIAYNLVRLVMAAAAPTQLGTVALSFSQVRRVLFSWFMAWGRDWRSRRGNLKQQCELLLAQASRELLPKRKRPRPSEPRRVRHRRQKYPPFSGSRAALRRKAKTANPKSW